MRLLIDRSLSEVRMRADADIFIENFRLLDLLDQIVLTATVDAEKRNQTITCEVDWKIEIEADRQFLLSAIANPLQNAIKYSKNGGHIFVRGQTSGDRALIEIEDECDGIEVEKVKPIFKPYVQANNDRSGLGLGLSITQRAIHLSHGKMSVYNKPNSGGIFVVDIPLELSPIPNQKNVVPGVDSVQPDLRRKN